MNFKVITLALAMGCASMAQAAADKVIGFYPYWSQYSQFYAKDIRYNLVTDIHYMSIAPSAEGTVAFADEYDADNFKNLVSMSKDNGVKLIVSVGGMEAESNLKAIASSDETLSTFVSNVKSWLSANGGDGVELDWQNLTTDDSEDYAKMLNALVDGLSGSTVTAVIYPAAGMESLENSFFPDETDPGHDVVVCAPMVVAEDLWIPVFMYASLFRQT